MNDSRESNPLAIVNLLKPTLSPTALGEYETCLRRGQFYHDPDIPRGGANMALAIGGAWHHMLETYGQMRLDNHQLLPIDHEPQLLAALTSKFVDITLEEGFRNDDPKLTEEKAVESLDRMFGTWTTGPPEVRWDDVEIAGVEEEVRVELGSNTHQLHGVIDAVYQLDRDRIVLVDYKTASRAWAHTAEGDGKGDGNPRKLIQAPLYAEAWERTRGEKVDWFAYDVMTYAGKFERVWVDVRHEVRKPFIKRWNLITEMIGRYGNEPMPTNPGSFLCSSKWCDYWTYCEMGEGLAREQAKGQGK